MKWFPGFAAEKFRSLNKEGRLDLKKERDKKNRNDEGRASMARSGDCQNKIL